jgi:hypothetical protein
MARIRLPAKLTPAWRDAAAHGFYMGMALGRSGRLTKAGFARMRSKARKLFPGKLYRAVQIGFNLAYRALEHNEWDRARRALGKRLTTEWARAWARKWLPAKRAKAAKPAVRDAGPGCQAPKRPTARKPPAKRSPQPSKGTARIRIQRGYMQVYDTSTSARRAVEHVVMMSHQTEHVDHALRPRENTGPLAGLVRTAHDKLQALGYDVQVTGEVTPQIVKALGMTMPRKLPKGVFAKRF